MARWRTVQSPSGRVTAPSRTGDATNLGAKASYGRGDCWGTQVSLECRGRRSVTAALREPSTTEAVPSSLLRRHPERVHLLSKRPS